MKKRHLANAGKTNPKRTQYEPKRTQLKPIQSQNEPKTNPIKANFQKAKMNVTSILTEGYENKSPIRAPKKQTQFSKRQKPMQTSLSKRIMKKTAFSGSEKTNPNKPNFTSAQRPATAGKEASAENQLLDGSGFSMLWSRLFHALDKERIF